MFKALHFASLTCVERSSVWEVTRVRIEVSRPCLSEKKVGFEVSRLWWRRRKGSRPGSIARCLTLKVVVYCICSGFDNTIMNITIQRPQWLVAPAINEVSYLAPSWVVHLMYTDLLVGCRRHSLLRTMFSTIFFFGYLSILAGCSIYSVLVCT